MKRKKIKISINNIFFLNEGFISMEIKLKILNNYINYFQVTES